jgi:CrcB protein
MPLAPLKLYLVVAIGSALGGVARYAFSGWIAGQFGETFPWGTLVVNVTGSFAIGFFATLTAPDGRFFVGAATRQFAMTGLCGGYTTFSSFSLQTLNLARDDQWLQVGANVTGSVVLCLVSTWAGHVCAAALNRLRGA